KGKNIFVLGLISKIFNLDDEKLKRLITEKFGGKNESVVNTALMAFQAGYAYPVGNVLTKHYRFEHIPRPSGRAQLTMDGNQALAYGLIAGRRWPRSRWSFAISNAAARVPVCPPTSSRAICTRRSSAVTATARASCSRLRAWKIASILRSKRHGLRGNTARPFSF